MHGTGPGGGTDGSTGRRVHADTDLVTDAGVTADIRKDRCTSS